MTIQARFIGGAWDGQTKRVPGARHHIVPVNYGTTGHADDVKWLNIDEVYAPKPARLETQTYTRREIRSEDGRIVEFVYELEPTS